SLLLIPGSLLLTLATPSRQWLYHNVFIINHTFWVMCLKGESPAIKFFLPGIGRTVLIFRLDVFHYGFTVDLHGDFSVFDDDMFGVPLIVLGVHFLDICKPVYTSGFSPVAMGLVHLDFIAFARPAAFLKFGMDENPGICPGFCFYLGFKFKVFK